MTRAGLQNKQFCQIGGNQMAYVEVGSGTPVVFLHGNPTSSYLWRNVLPHVAPLARCIAPDLIGMGDSDKLEGDDPARYSFLEHRKFLDSFISSLGIGQELVLVGHDWGGVLAMDWARRHPDAVRGVVYFETTVRPRKWSEINPAQKAFFERLRSPEGEKLVLEENLFIEKLLTDWIARPLSVEEMNEYRRPFLKPGEDRRPTLSFPREILIDNEPAYMLPIVREYAAWMASSDVPKLFISGMPGAIIFGDVREYCRTWRNQEEVQVPGRHYLQEDSPHEIGRAIAEWLTKIGYSRNGTRS